MGGLARLRVEKAPGLGIAGDYLTEQPADLLAEKKRRTGKDRNVMAIFTPATDHRRRSTPGQPMPLDVAPWDWAQQQESVSLPDDAYPHVIELDPVPL
ncbi:hypothetical protein Y900_030605 [Mycolicibacterium aromaticivorans JS19b1 = JCM 16368]|uniref:Uncharacterized protein n=2 Tax=Mycobacteriaceae TaxID=1762 RepID=A0A064C7R3_9MYCO|nr:hypothetical protein Y900_030605 [Mycolicibacterium aromaticivorans JS19b1 = JCM 16368]